MLLLAPHSAPPPRLLRALACTRGTQIVAAARALRTAAPLTTPAPSPSPQPLLSTPAPSPSPQPLLSPSPSPLPPPPASPLPPAISSSLRRVVSVLVIDATGAVTEQRMPITALKSESHLHMRELLIVEQPAALVTPRILPRRHCVVITLGPVRAILFADRAYLFSHGVLPGVRDYATALGLHVQQAAAAAAATRGGGNGAQVDVAPFELLVMEHALLTQTQRQSKRVAYAKRLLDRVLSKVGTVERDDGNLAALFPLASTIAHYEGITRGLCDCVRDLLDDDRDMREACLGEKRRIAALMQLEAAEASAAEAREQAALAEAQITTADAAGDSAPAPLPFKQQARRAPPSALPMNEELPPQRRVSFPWSALRPQTNSASEQMYRNSGGLVRAIIGGSGSSGSGSSSSTSSGGFGGSGGGSHGMGVGSGDDARVLQVSADALSQLELMLESVYHQAAEANTETVELGRTIRTKRDLLELQQSNYRNFILSVTLRMSVFSTSVGAATFLTSAFGQNLSSGIDHVPGLLWVATAVSLAFGWRLFRIIDRHTFSSSPTQAAARRLQALHEFLAKLDVKVDAARSTLAAVGADESARQERSEQRGEQRGELRGEQRANVREQRRDLREQNEQQRGRIISRLISHEFGGGLLAAVMSPRAAFAAASSQRRPMQLAGQGGHPSSLMTRAQFKQVHEAATGTAISDDEVEIIFDLFDADEDNKLRIEDVADTSALANFKSPAGAGNGSVGS